VVIYTASNFWLRGHQGNHFGPIIFIHPDYRDDIGLYEHEKTHVRQFWRYLGLNEILYQFFGDFRLKMEVEAYRKQLEFSPGRELVFAGFIATRYELDITVAAALELLS